MFYSLKSRLIAVFVLLFVLTFGTLSVVLFNEARTIIRSYIESSALEKMEEYGSYVSMVQTQVYDLASIVFNSEATRNWDNKVSDPTVSEGDKMFAHIEMSNFLTRTTNSYSSVSNVAIYRQEGVWVGAEQAIVQEVDYMLEPWFIDFFAQGRHWMTAHTDDAELMRNNPNPVVSMLMPIGTFEPTHAKSVMKVNVNADYFLRPLSRIHLGESGTIYLLDDRGESMLGQSTYGDYPGTAEAVTEIRGGVSRSGVMYRENDQGNQDIIVYKKLPRTNWTLVGFVTEEDLYAPLFKLRNSMIIFASVLLVVAVLAAIWLSHGVTKPLSRLVLAMRQVQRGDFDSAEQRLPEPQQSMTSEIGFATTTFRTMVGQLRQHIKTEFELKLLRQQAEYKALLMQINPHFLFNTLELMSSLAMQRRTEDTVEVIESLGKMMRFSLKFSDDLVTLEEELRYVQDYVTILQVRFGDRLDIRLTREGDLEGLTVIKFILQPLIENSVKYSFRHQEQAIVRIAVARREDRLHLVVSDNGPGLSPEADEKLRGQLTSVQLDTMLDSRTGQIGLGNVLARCRLYYGERFEMQWGTGEDGGARIELILHADNL
ncbi:sensor histidine kinase [Paenibacillus daejeonensis]|uniref:sensor histidine kinase n=1 Tax=Paenibacillus daejeonensis TaxID=135193 RepID=UPI00037C5A78|nr:sensor histidine kinase [Paenibacillus daejeonensis]